MQALKTGHPLLFVSPEKLLLIVEYLLIYTIITNDVCRLMTKSGWAFFGLNNPPISIHPRLDKG
jgi:hypothetical protein